MNSTSEEDFESDSDNSIIESEAFQKHKKEAILFEAIKSFALRHLSKRTKVRRRKVR